MPLKQFEQTGFGQDSSVYYLRCDTCPLRLIHLHRLPHLKGSLVLRPVLQKSAVKMVIL
jgi:hypothetical protein